MEMLNSVQDDSDLASDRSTSEARSPDPSQAIVFYVLFPTPLPWLLPAAVPAQHRS